jgi:hypothetical protein
MALKWCDTAFKLATVGVNVKLLKSSHSAWRNEDNNILIMLPKHAGRGQLEVKVAKGEGNGL